MLYARCGKRSRITSEGNDTSRRSRLRLLRGTCKLSLTYPRYMHRAVAATALTLAVLLGFGSCAQTDISASDIYRIGCPAVDAAAGGGPMGSKGTGLGPEN